MWRVDSRSLRLALSLGVVLGLGATATYAAWIDTVSASGTTIRTATVDLRVQGSDTVTGYSPLNAAGLFPGDSTAGVLTVSNNGTMPLRYHVNASTTNPDGKGLAAAVNVKVTGDATVSGTAPNVGCAGAAHTGTSAVLGANLVGSPASPRTLATGASETLCIQVTLPSSAAQNLESASTAVSFGFSATTSPQTSWTDTVTVSGTTIGTGSTAAPVVSCGTVTGTSTVVNWSSVSRASGYRLSYGLGGTTTADVGTAPTSRTFTDPSQGTFSVRTRYGTTWLSAPSNSVAYKSTSDEDYCR